MQSWSEGCTGWSLCCSLEVELLLRAVKDSADWARCTHIMEGPRHSLLVQTLISSKNHVHCRIHSGVGPDGARLAMLAGNLDRRNHSTLVHGD